MRNHKRLSPLLLVLGLACAGDVFADANCNKGLFTDEYGNSYCGACSSSPGGSTPGSRYAFKKEFFFFCVACNQLCTVSQNGADPAEKSSCQAAQAPPLRSDEHHYAVDFASESTLIQQMTAAAPEQVALLATSRIEDPNALEVDQSHRRMYTQSIPTEALVRKILLGSPESELTLMPLESLEKGELLAVESWTKMLPDDRIAIEFRSTIVRADNLSPIRVLRQSTLELDRSPLSQKGLVGSGVAKNYYRPVKFSLTD